MKAIIKYPLMLGLTGVLFTACRDEEKEHAMQQVSVLSSSNDSLENALVSTLDEINQNLDMIKDKQGIILNTDGKESISRKASILKNISMINALIEENKQKIEELNEQAKKLGKDKSALVRIAQQTKVRIEKQEEEIALLKQQLADESYKVSDLNKRMDIMQVTNETLTSEKMQLSETNAQLDEDLNKAYFAVGKYKELRDKKLVEKTGGVLGIGKKETLANTFYRNKTSFREVDVRETKIIPIEGKDPKLVTFHPANSYEIIEEKDSKYASIAIKDPDEFWSSSKYLVVEVK